MVWRSLPQITCFNLSRSESLSNESDFALSRPRDKCSLPIHQINIARWLYQRQLFHAGPSGVHFQWERESASKAEATHHLSTLQTTTAQ